MSDLAFVALVALRIAKPFIPWALLFLGAFALRWVISKACIVRERHIEERSNHQAAVARFYKQFRNDA